MNKKFVISIVSVFLISIAIIGLNYYNKIFSNNTTKSGDLYIKPTDNLSDVQQKIALFIKDQSSFIWVANQKKFKTPKSGRYIIKEGMSNNDLVNMLRSGRQTPVKVSFNNQNTLPAFAKRIAEQLAIDSVDVIQSFTNKSFLEKNNFTKKSVLQIALPNTYEFYWNVSADSFRDKLLSYYQRFWTKSRIEKAKELRLTKGEVITLASIVQQETAKEEERPIVAGLYLNRLKNGWPLQADPTLIYVLKEIHGFNYVVKRVLKADKLLDSPYNTYKYKGLPPSQIAMPDIDAIDAVLNPRNHNYFYMCANPDKIGYHKFAKTLAQHNRNATQYQNWLNKHGIKR